MRRAGRWVLATLAAGAAATADDVILEELNSKRFTAVRQSALQQYTGTHGRRQLSSLCYFLSTLQETWCSQPNACAGLPASAIVRSVWLALSMYFRAPFTLPGHVSLTC